MQTPNQLSSNTGGNSVRIQLQQHNVQNQQRLSGVPQTVQIINTSVGGQIVNTPRLTTLPNQQVTLLPGPRTGGGPQRVVIRPHHTLQNPAPQQFSARHIAPAIQPRPVVYASGVSSQPGVQIIASPQQSIQLLTNASAQRTPQSQQQTARLIPSVSGELPSQQASMRPLGSALLNSKEPQSTIPPPKIRNSDLLDRRRIQELVKEIDPNQQLDEEVQNLLLEIADDFIEKTINSSCQIAQHRNASALEASDVQLCLERNYNLWVPGFTDNTDDPNSAISGLFAAGANGSKKNLGTEAHRQRMAVLRKTFKK